MDSVDWNEIERWIEDELLDEEEREAYCERRACLVTTEKEDKKVEEQARRERGRQLAFYVEDEFAARVRAFCRENHMMIGEFCRKAIEAALETAQTVATEPVGETVEQEQSEETSVVAPATPTRGLILDIARQIVCADRNDTYGSAEDNFGIIAELWKPYLKGRGIAADNLTSMDVAILMIQLKVARVATGKFKLDNFVDICGYAACGGECGGRHD